MSKKATINKKVKELEKSGDLTLSTDGGGVLLLVIMPTFGSVA